MRGIICEWIGVCVLVCLVLIVGTTPPVASDSYSNTKTSPPANYYFNVAAKDSGGNMGGLASEKSGKTTTKGLYDDFEGGTYNLSDGQKSPNGKWIDRYNGYGLAGVRTESDGNNVLFEYPKAATSPNTTSAGLVVSTVNFSDFVMELDMRTDKQLRQNSPPNSSEVAWVNWRIADDFHAYYFLIKTNGIEFGKKDNNCRCEQQVFMKTGPSPTVELGVWAHVKISSIGKHTIIWVDGTKVVDMDDPTYNKAQMSSGAIGLYNEDSSVAFDNIYVKPRHVKRH